MSHTCKEIEENKGSYQKYRFEAVSRHDEIGQLAVTFEGLLKNMDNYTKMEYTSRMAATLAHEIKNPIAGIRSGIQLLKGRAVKDGDKMLCDSMIHEIDRVTALIMNLLTLSIRRESLKTEVSVTGVLKEIGMIYAKGPDSRRASLLVEAEEGLRRVSMKMSSVRSSQPDQQQPEGAGTGPRGTDQAHGSRAGERSACDGAGQRKRHDGGRSFQGAGTILYKEHQRNRAWALNREPPGGVKWRNDGDREQAGGRDRRGFKISGENGIV